MITQSDETGKKTWDSVGLKFCSFSWRFPFLLPVEMTQPVISLHLLFLFLLYERSVYPNKCCMLFSPKHSSLSKAWVLMIICFYLAKVILMLFIAIADSKD